MPRLDFSVTHIEAPEDEAFGPEKATWARFELRIDDFCLTRNHSQEAFLLPADGGARDAVEGPLNGVAEWIVDHFADTLWDANVPVPKHDSIDGTRTAIPGLREAARWWDDLAGRHSRQFIAKWQQRHTLGAAMSQLALPSLVFMPEAGHIGLFATALPAELNGNARFRLPDNGSEFWLDRDDLRETLACLVDGIIGRAGTSADGRHWASWLGDRWEAAKQVEVSLIERRKRLFGTTVANAWETRVEPLGNRKPIVEGVLSDLAPIESEASLDTLLRALPLGDDARSDERRWRKLVQQGPSVSARAYEQGYELARSVRHALDRGADPIERMDVLLGEIDVIDRESESGGLFRTLSCVRDRQASVVVSRDLRGVIPRRVALASALGRLLFESRGRDWAAAISDQSRWQETRRANAFAAELLAPAEAVRNYSGDPERLAGDYGISLTSARWRIKNVFQPPA